MSAIKLFETKQVRSEWVQEAETWIFSIVDVVAALTDSADAAAPYWRKLKQRLKAEGDEPVTNCHGLKLQALDGKMCITDAADTKQLFSLNAIDTVIQSGVFQTVDCTDTFKGGHL